MLSDCSALHRGPCRWALVSLRLSCYWWAEQLLARQTALRLAPKLLPSMQGSNMPAQVVARPVSASAYAASLGQLQGSYSLAGHEQRDTVFVRGYMNGKLEREEVVTAEERDAVFGPLEKRQERKNRRRHRTARVRHAGHLVGCSTAARHLVRLPQWQGT